MPGYRKLVSFFKITTSTAGSIMSGPVLIKYITKQIYIYIAALYEEPDETTVEKNIELPLIVVYETHIAKISLLSHSNTLVLFFSFSIIYVLYIILLLLLSSSSVRCTIMPVRISPQNRRWRKSNARKFRFVPRTMMAPRLRCSTRYNIICVCVCIFIIGSPLTEKLKGACIYGQKQHCRLYVRLLYNILYIYLFFPFFQNHRPNILYIYYILHAISTLVIHTNCILFVLTSFYRDIRCTMTGPYSIVDAMTSSVCVVYVCVCLCARGK